jgi:arylsulfatase A-like enzyme
MCDRVASLTNGDTYIYAYWPDIDSLIHDLGTTHDDVHAAVQRVDDALSSLAERLDDTLLIVTADHGLIDIDTKLYVNDHPELRNTLRIPLCGEPRAAYAYVKPGSEAAFTNQVHDAFGDACDVLPSTQLVDEEYFGMGKPSAELIDRIGDYVILPNESHVIYDLLSKEEAVHTGFHGGLTEEEMLVPLIIYAS